jgi:hypothetical protein
MTIHAPLINGANSIHTITSVNAALTRLSLELYENSHAASPTGSQPFGSLSPITH